MSRETKVHKLARRLMGDRAMLPEARVGEFAVKHEHHKAGDELYLVIPRVAMMTGQRSQNYTCPADTTVQYLTEHNGVWMSDLPCEMVQMHDELAKHARGAVLVGGLGLGIVARMCALKDNVTSVVVVEQSSEVAQLVWPHIEPQLGGKGTLHVADINAVEIDHRRYDTALLDTWQGTNELTWSSEVVPLRRRFARKIARIHCWQEQTMLTQIYRTLMGAVAVSADYFTSGACAPQYAFVSALDEMGIARETALVDGRPDFGMAFERARYANMANAQLRSLALEFVHFVGTKRWEQIFGKHWDAVARKEAA